MKHKRFLAWAKKNRTALIWGISAAVVVIGGAVYWIGNSISNDVTKRGTLYDVPILDFDLKIFETPLSGIKTDVLDSKRPVTGIVVENSPDARPQSGLDQAEVVFEAIAEGGITRFITFWQAEQPEKIGPIRSARPHFNQWVLSYDASYVHAGGSGNALAEISKWGMKDLNTFSNPVYFYRDSSRFAPHNLYSSMDEIDKLNAKKGYTESEFDGWLFTDGVPASDIDAKTIDIEVSSPLYNVSYLYNSSLNQYKRSVGGAKHIDANSGKQITVDNVIVMEVPYTISSPYYNYDLYGSGKAHIFKNGHYRKATWVHKKRGDMFKFYVGEDQEEYTFNRGQTWITAIKPGNSVTVKGK